MNKAKQFKIALFLCLGLASCHHKENLQIPETKVVEGTFYVDIYDEENEVLILLLVLAINQFDKDVAASAAASSSHSSASHN